MDEIKTLLKEIEELKGEEAVLRDKRQTLEAKARRITLTPEAAEAEG